MRAPTRLAVRASAFVAVLAACALAASLAGCGLFAPPPGSLPAPARLSGSETTAVPALVAEPPTLSVPVAPPEQGAFIGVYHPPAPFQLASLDAYAKVSDKPPAILMWYQPWAPGQPREFDPAACVAVFQRGAVPMISWEPWDPGKNANYLMNPSRQPAYRLSRIVDGDFDPYIRRFARDVKSVRGPVMIRLMHEMNGNWYPWAGSVNGNTPAQYVKAWRHVHGIFAEEGATNVTWVWSINHESVPSGPANRYAVYYPGDRYVDWVAMSGFNWGNSSSYSTWRTFDFRYATPLAYLKTLHKPVVIAEFGSVEGGGDKAAWMRDAYGRIRTQHPEVKAVVYFDSREKGPGSTEDWRITSSKESAEAFRTAIGATYFRAGPASTLADWTVGLDWANWLYLRELQPVY